MKILCKIFGHNWNNFEQFKRRCVRCNKEQWVFGTKYPKIGEPKYNWKDIN